MKKNENNYNIGFKEGTEFILLQLLYCGLDSSILQSITKISNEELSQLENTVKMNLIF